MYCKLQNFSGLQAHVLVKYSDSNNVDEDKEQRVLMCPGYCELGVPNETVLSVNTSTT